MKTTLGLAACLLALAPATALSGPERVELPAHYRDVFVLYNQIERPDRKPPQIRFMYASPDAVAAATPDQAAPYGTVLIMEDRTVRLDANGNPVRGKDGRLVASDQVVNIFVQQKGKGWGDAYPPERRNGDWEYAWFNPDGSRRANAKFDGCFSCHMPRASRDYTFTFMKWVQDGKP